MERAGRRGRARVARAGQREARPPAPGPDCEARRATWPAEPVNALSSLAFLPAGAVVARRAGATGPAGPRLLAAALVANGLGSGWYHARAGPGSRWAHDTAVSAGLWLLAPVPRGRPRLPRDLAGLVVAVAAHALRPEATAPVHTALVAAWLVAAARAGRRERRWRGWAARPWRRAATVALLAGGACHRAGRPGSRWCRPGSRLQPHAAWHLLAAVGATALALDAAADVDADGGAVRPVTAAG